MRPRRTGRPPVLPVVAAATVLLAGCSFPDEPTSTPSTAPEEITCPDGAPLRDGAPARYAPPPAPAEAPGAGRDGALDVGTLLPRSGDLSFLGAAPAAGVELAVADVDAAGGVRGEPLTLHPGDSADGTPGTAEAEVERLLGAGVDVIVGPMASGVAARVLDQVTHGGALLITPGATSTGLDDLDGDDRLFRTVPTDTVQGRALADLVLDDGPRAVALVVRDDDYGRTIADAFTERFEAGRGVIRSRTDYDPTDEDVTRDLGGAVIEGSEAVVVIGLAETARVIDELAEAGAGPAERPVYGTDGNLGERLADLVDDPASLACMKGILPAAAPPASFADRLRRAFPALRDVDDAALAHAAEAYDAVVIAALAAEAAQSDDVGAIAQALTAVTRGGTTCDDVATCLDLVGRGVDVAYEGATGQAALGAAGNRTRAQVTVVVFDRDGHLAAVSTRSVRA